INIMYDEKQTNVKYGSVSAAHPLAVETGLNIMEQGGNAIDASIAISFMLGVVEPYGSGIGGGGVKLIYSEKKQQPYFYDYRECAAWTGKGTSLNIGIPGMVKGMEQIHQDFGTLEWETLIEPAIRIAYDGFAAHKILVEQLKKAKHLDRQQLQHFYPNNKALKIGEIIKQQELAKTLENIAVHGSDIFYKGYIAEEISTAIKDLHIDDFK